MVWNSYTVKRGHVHVTLTLRHIHITTVAGESSKYYIFICACANADGDEGVRVCVHVGGGGCGCMSAGVCLHMCRLTYPVWYMWAPHCLRPLWLHHIFWHYLIKSTIFRKKSLNMSVLIFSTTFIWNTSHYKKKSTTYCHKCENIM